MVREEFEDWDEIIEICYRIADDNHGRGIDFLQTLSKALKIAGEFQVGQGIGLQLL